MDDVNESVEKEKTTIMNILKEDILQTEEKEEEDKEEGQEINIEWNPDF